MFLKECQPKLENECPIDSEGYEQCQRGSQLVARGFALVRSDKALHKGRTHTTKTNLQLKASGINGGSLGVTDKIIVSTYQN